MFARLIMGSAAFLMLWPAFPERRIQIHQSPPQIHRNLDEIDECLNQIARDLQQLRDAIERFKKDKRPVDIRWTSEYRELQKRFKELEKKVGAEASGSPAEIWHAMGDPKELARRLDSLVTAFAPTISEPDRRMEFEKDVQALKEKVGKEVSEEEFYEEVRERLLERMERATNEREKAWIKGQLRALERSEGPVRKEMIDRYVRIENIAAMHELAQKYAIPREQMVKCGLAFVGYAKRPPPRFERGERPGPPGGRPEGAPGRRRER